MPPDTDRSELDPLVELAEEKLRRVQTMHQGGSVAPTEVLKAEESVLQARLRSAAASEKVDAAVAYAKQLVDIAEQLREQAQARYEFGATSVSELRDARRQVVESQITLADLQGNREELARHLRKLVELTEESLKQVREMSEHGTATQSDVESAQQDAVAARLRLQMATTGPAEEHGAAVVPHR